MQPVTPQRLVQLARSVLFTRQDAFIHLSNERAREEVRAAESAFWNEAKLADGSSMTEEDLTRVLARGGVDAAQARRWSRAIVRSEEDDEIELDPPANCRHCGSSMRGLVDCRVCGQSIHSAREADDDDNAARARDVVRSLVADGRLELAVPTADQRVIADTALLLDANETAELPIIAEELEAMWLEHDDVAELFADRDAIVATLQDH